MSDHKEEELNEDVGKLSIGDTNQQESTEIKEDTVDESINNEQDPIEENGTTEETEVAQVQENDYTKEEAPLEVEEDEDDDDDDDDDFGAFSDASFDEFEQPQEATTPTTTTTIPTTRTTNNYTKLPQPLLEEPEMFQSTISKLLQESYPEELPESLAPENTDVLNERSRLLLERLTALPYLKPYSWKRSSLRRQLLLTLGIEDSEDGAKRKRVISDGLQYKIKSFEELGMNEDVADKYKKDTEDLLNKFEVTIKEDEELESLDDGRLAQVVDQYQKDIKELERLLAVWENEQKKLENDNATFEGVVENLVGHTQRLRREETLKSLKKEAHKSKGIGSMFKKKSKK